ncbi:PHP domain-containing protein [Acinetobacter junii]|jgi:predicted metal-dependent phosphoesterase TrpH|uniref:PHP domain-containing protein n=1 Tax=Acinetobacter junii TaxID=40215 RepID=A0AAW5REB6_ACIJU|nr:MULTISPECIES: PHP domain-containing protein [Acinetobacter]MBQ1493743.1 PHP domain-containing protein [Acinetobacter sp.]MBF4454881.1 PHP domain-containing protein [Acinetobacter sp. SK-43]MCE6003722.1 PHP domain-containing protein [Acinetobacter junii]MCU4398292.1 PHP domain-containing protein [Acinetobacter junii]MDA3500108.1 PHP domain-containing protein [Acinetobacter sp. AOR34_HL]
MFGVDLHTHTHISDGTFSPEQLVQAAVDLKIHMLAVTDHDTMDGLSSARKYAQDHDIQIISGVEISSQWSRPNTKKSYGVHIVALNMQDETPIQAMLENQKKVRAERAKVICDLLEKCIDFDIYPDVIAKVDGQADRVTRTHIAKTLVEKNIVSRPQQAFDRFLKEGKKAFVKFEGLGLKDTIDVIHASQGFAVLAHPTRYDLSATNIRYLIELFAEAGGDAVELPPSIEPASTRQMVDRMIQQFDLAVSIGSDFHGENMPWIKLGNTPRVKEGQIGIWDRFQ